MGELEHSWLGECRTRQWHVRDADPEFTDWLLVPVVQKLGEYKHHVAETYATKDDVKELGDRIERSMVKEFDRIHSLLQGREVA